MKHTFTKTIVAALATLLTSTFAFAEFSRDGGRDVDSDDRSTVEAVCVADSGNLSAVVTSHHGHAYLEVFEGNRLVESSYADRTESYSGGVYIIGYSTGPVTRGGVNLRIRTYDRDAASLEGFGHLTMKSNRRAVNKLVECFTN
jgi:hypothetical protein